MMRTNWIVLIGFLLFACRAELPPTADNNTADLQSVRAKGTLFVIGGGPRPPEIIAAMVEAAMAEDPYGLIFPQASSEPDSAYFYIAKDFAAHTSMPMVMVKQASPRPGLIDSLQRAPLVFITGGDQNRFMEHVHPTVRSAIREAYMQGTVVGGTSAGAAMMGKVMITGDQLDWPLYESTYSRLHYGNGIYSDGLGLLDSIVVDQHFVARSRYNRLISVLADTKMPYAVGVDEETAFVLAPDFCTVVGANQVVVLRRPEAFTEKNSRIGARALPMDIYLHNDTFNLNY